MNTMHTLRVDKDRSGAISADELQQALSNGKKTVLYITYVLQS